MVLFDFLGCVWLELLIKIFLATLNHDNKLLWTIYSGFCIFLSKLNKLNF